MKTLTSHEETRIVHYLSNVANLATPDPILSYRLGASDILQILGIDYSKIDKLFAEAKRNIDNRNGYVS